MKKFLPILLLVSVLWGAVAFTVTRCMCMEQAQAQQVPVAKPVRVYMLHDPVKDKWYRVNLGGLSSWGHQNQGGVWTVQADVKTLLSTMLGKRPKRYKIEAFLLIPVKNNK